MAFWWRWPMVGASEASSSSESSWMLLELVILCKCVFETDWQSISLGILLVSFCSFLWMMKRDIYQCFASGDVVLRVGHGQFEALVLCVFTVSLYQPAELPILWYRWGVISSRGDVWSCYHSPTCFDTFLLILRCLHIYRSEKLYMFYCIHYLDSLILPVRFLTGTSCGGTFSIANGASDI